MRKMIAFAESGVAHSYFCYDESGSLIWDTIAAAFVAFVDANYARYRVTAAEVGSSRRYVGTPPAGTVYYELRENGPSLATSYPRFDGTFYVDQLNTIAAVGLESANLASLVNAVVGPNVVTPVDAGIYDIAIRNTANDATLVTIRFNLVTGAKTIL